MVGDGAARARTVPAEERRRAWRLMMAHPAKQQHLGRVQRSPSFIPMARVKFAGVERRRGVTITQAISKLPRSQIVTAPSGLLRINEQFFPMRLREQPRKEHC